MNRIALLVISLTLISSCTDEVQPNDFIGAYEGTAYRDNPYTQVFLSESEYTLELTTDTLDNFGIWIRRANEYSNKLQVEFMTINTSLFEATEQQDTLIFEVNNSDLIRNDIHRGKLWLSPDSIHLYYYRDFTNTYNIPFGALPEQRIIYGALPR
ncbi:MAG: hypothetical protein AAFO03_02405 [Bacteroidota bacterium]